MFNLLLPDDIVAEIVRAEPLENGARILDVPAFNGTYNVFDTALFMTANGENFAYEIAKSAGWSNVGLHIDGQFKRKIVEIMKEIELLGCIVSSRKPVQINIAIPKDTYNDAMDTLEDGELLGYWEMGMILDRNKKTQEPS